MRFRADRRALLVNFSSFNNAVSVTYSLTYTSNGKSSGNQRHGFGLCQYDILKKMNKKPLIIALLIISLILAA